MPPMIIKRREDLSQVGIKVPVSTSSNPGRVSYLPHHLQLTISASIILAPRATLNCFIELKKNIKTQSPPRDHPISHSGQSEAPKS